MHSIPSVAAEEIAGSRRASANHVVAGRIHDHDAAHLVAERLHTRHIRANDVSYDFIVGGPGALQHDPVLGIAADEVARIGRFSAHHVTAGTAEQDHAICVVAGRGRAFRVCADVVAHHPVAGRPQAL